MGEYEPDDSRDVTLSDHQAPGEPPRTGPRENEARRHAEQREGAKAAADKDEMAIDNPAGDPRPEYDQYALNDPESIDKRDARNVEAADGEGDDA